MMFECLKLEPKYNFNDIIKKFNNCGFVVEPEVR